MGGAGLRRSAAWAVLGVAVAYWLLARLNGAILSEATWARFTEGVDWIFLPSGLRLLAVLVFGIWGSVGISLATWALTVQVNPADPWWMDGGTALISGFSPLLASQLGRFWLKLPSDLHGLTPWPLIQLAALFALLSGSLHQVWYLWSGHTSTPLSSAVVMVIGDFLGSLILLFLINWGLRNLSRLR